MRARFTAATLDHLAKFSFCHAIREHSNHTVETVTFPTPVFPASHVLCPLLLPVQQLNSIASTVRVFEKSTGSIVTTLRMLLLQILAQVLEQSLRLLHIPFFLPKTLAT